MGINTSNSYKIGCTASVSKGIINAVEYSKHINGNVTQIFIGNNRSISLDYKSKITNEECIEMKEWLKNNNHTLIIHSPYVINFSKHDVGEGSGVIHRKSLEWDLLKGELMGALGCVIHMGFKGTKTDEEAIKIMVRNVKKVIQDTSLKVKKCKIILETSCKNGQICFKLEDFAKLWKMFTTEEHKRLGICVDTAHIFTAGYGINTIKGVDNFFKEFDKLIGLNKITCFHINDSKAILGSRKDMHEGIGDGYIYNKGMGGNLSALKQLADVSKKLKCPMALETHGSGYYGVDKDNGKYYQEIELFRRWDKGENPRFKLKSSMKIPESKSQSQPSQSGGVKSTKTISPKTTTSKSPKIIKGRLKHQKNHHPNARYLKYENNKKIVHNISQLEQYYKIIGDTYRAYTYGRALYQLMNYSEEIKSGKQIEYLDFIGKAIVKKIDEIIETGTLSYLEDKEVKKVLESHHKKFNDSPKSPTKSAHKLPVDKVFGIGKKKRDELNKQGIESINNLVKANKTGNTELSEQQKLGLKYAKLIDYKIKKKDAEKLMKTINKTLQKSDDEDINSLNIELSGSYLSDDIQFLGDVDMIIVSKSDNKNNNNKILKKIIKYLTDNNVIEVTFSLGKSKFLGLAKSVNDNKFYRIDIMIIPNDSVITARLYFSSGATFNKIIRSLAKKKGYKLNEWGLFKITKDDDGNKTETKIKLRDEEHIFKILNMQFVPVNERR